MLNIPEVLGQAVLGGVELRPVLPGHPHPGVLILKLEFHIIRVCESGSKRVVGGGQTEFMALVL